MQSERHTDPYEYCSDGLGRRYNSSPNNMQSCFTNIRRSQYRPAIVPFQRTILFFCSFCSFVRLLFWFAMRPAAMARLHAEHKSTCTLYNDIATKRIGYMTERLQRAGTNCFCRFYAHCLILRLNMSKSMPGGCAAAAAAAAPAVQWAIKSADLEMRLHATTPVISCRAGPG